MRYSPYCLVVVGIALVLVESPYQQSFQKSAIYENSRDSKEGDERARNSMKHC